MHTLVVLLKRRPGMSRAAFREHYETTHAPLCLKYMVGVARYTRRYLEPAPGAPEPEYDVITELQFKHRAAFDYVLANAGRGELPPDVLEDEHNLFDRAASRFCAVSDCVTVPDGGGRT